MMTSQVLFIQPQLGPLDFSGKIHSNKFSRSYSKYTGQLPSQQLYKPHTSVSLKLSNMDDLRTNIEKILANIREEQVTLFKQTADRYILLSNMESFLTSIIYRSDNIHPSQDNFILVDYDVIMEQCLRDDTANILVDDMIHMQSNQLQS